MGRLVDRLISLVNFYEMALQFIWWREISKDPLFEARLARKKVLFYQDNASSHKSLQWQNYELGYELISHPPYSPDLTSCDFFLFLNLKTWLGGKKFSSNEEVIVAVNEYFADFETTYFKW